MELTCVLVTARLKPENRRRLAEALAPAEAVFCDPEDRAAIARHIGRADAAILDGDADEVILAGPRLRWIHCCHAGLDRTARPELFRRGIILTGSAGRSAPALAEHALLFMLALAYRLPALLEAQAARRWLPPSFYAGRTGLTGSTVGLVGLGHTGRALARLTKALGMRTVAWRRSDGPCHDVDRLYSAARGEGLGPLLAESDFVVLCASLNDETYHLIGEAALRAMKPTACLINVARGGLVDEAALTAALAAGEIAGAGLDTVEHEPLDPASPLWTMPQVILTPHLTPPLRDREERALSYVLENLAACRRGSGFVNRLTERDCCTRVRTE